MQVAYIKKLHLLFVPSPCYFYDPLRPTGQWKIVREPENHAALYIEHRGALFNRWIHEDSIVFGPLEKEEIFVCKRSQEKPKMPFVIRRCIMSLAICGIAKYCLYLGGSLVIVVGAALFGLILVWNPE